MSRGPGRWQRLILQRVEQGDWLYLVELLPEGYTNSQYQAIYRAACTLHDAGRISWLRYRFGLKKTLLGPQGAEAPTKRPPGYGRWD